MSTTSSTPENAESAPVATGSALALTEPKSRFTYDQSTPNLSNRQFLWAVAAPLALPAWTQTRRDLANDILSRVSAWSKTNATAGATTLADGAILTVWIEPNGEFYETVGGKFTDGKRWRMEARNRDSALSLILPHIDDICPDCMGLGGSMKNVAGDWEEWDCPRCGGLGVLPGSEAYRARRARIDAMREKARKSAADLPF